MLKDCYRFRDQWRVEATPEEVFCIMEDVSKMPQWWPAVVLRADLTWLLAAARASTESLPSVNGATAEVLQVLHARGASFANDLSAATRQPPDLVERALWDGVARGLVMCDGFAAIRSLL